MLLRRELCGHCLFFPGWHHSAELRAIIAPEGLPNLPALEREPAAVHEPRRQPAPLKAQWRFLRVLGRPFRRAPKIMGR